MSEALRLLQIIADPTRSQIIQSLAEGEKTVKELCNLVGGSQPATSHHLALLRNAGVVTRQRQGNKDVYVLTEQGTLLAKFKVVTKVRSKDQERSGAKSLGIDPALLDDVAGFVDDPEAWFTTPNEVFGGQKPIELLGTDDEPRLRNRIEMAKLGMFS
jgi:DNA-binding transcriptional ArsR family regulator